MKLSITKLALSLIFLLACSAYANTVNKTAAIPASLGVVKQKSLEYLPRHPLPLQQKYSQRLAMGFLGHYFSPWTGVGLINAIPEVKTLEQEVIAAFSNNPGWDGNEQFHTDQWIRQMIGNMQLARFPNNLRKAITVKDGAIRMLPTEEASLKEPADYPFDRMQQSFLPANTPVLILHTTKNQNWHLVMTASSFGWIKNQNLALVSSEFIKHWRTANYVVTTKEGIVNLKEDLPLKMRLGTIYPLKQPLAFSYEISIAVKNSKNQAEIKEVKVPKKLLALFPQKLAYKKIAAAADSMLGDPYGWGGWQGLRDCSSTLMDLMGVFGIWLPRNSQDQVDRVGQQISLRGMSDIQKEAIIIKYGIPFFTLIHLPGHIMLYIGHKKGRAYVYQSVWSFRGTVITPLQVVSRKSSRTILGAVDKIAILIPS